MNDSSTTPAKKRVLFVCMGNICRSPTGEGVMQSVVERTKSDIAIEVDSAGTRGPWTSLPLITVERKGSRRYST